MAALLAGAALSGCATRGAVARVDDDVAQLAAELHDTRRQVVAIDSLVRTQGEELRRLGVEQAAATDDLQRRLQQAQPRLDDIAWRLAATAEGVETLRVYGGAAGPPAPAAASPARGPADPGAAASVAARAGESPSDRGVGIDPRGLYDQAQADMKRGDFALAAAEFARLLETAPDSDLADNAGYWVGECHYARHDFAQAVTAFERALKAYPDGDKAPATMLKLAYSLLETKQRKRGVQTLSDLVRRFPRSEEAGLARTRLKALGAPVPSTGR